MTEQSPEPGPRFPATRWSMVLRTRAEGPAARQALEELCATYWFPLYAWCRARGLAAHDAEDLIQGFFVKILQSQAFGVADPARGKLRTYLLTALQRYIRDESEKACAEKRGGGRVISMESAEASYAASLVSGESPEQTYDRQWALTVIDQALGHLEKQAMASGRLAHFVSMKQFLSEEGDMATYGSLAASLGMSPGSFKVAVHRLRVQFREALQGVVRDTQDNQPEEELAYLAKVLATA